MSSIKQILGGVLRRMPNPIDRLPAERKQERVRRRAKRRIQQGKGPKVFGIGLSKTGSHSLTKALNLLGYKAMTWARDGKILDWPEFYLADAVTGTTCCDRFESLYYTCEDSKFIYLTRDLSSWTRSMRAHFGHESPDQLREYWRRDDFWDGGKEEWRWNPHWKWHNAFQWMRIHKNLYARFDTWEEAYRSYDERVRTFFQDKPSNRFLVMNITEGGGWETLCSFLGEDVPARPFPHLNKTDYSEQDTEAVR